MNHGLSWVLVNLWKGEPGEEALEAELRPSGEEFRGPTYLEHEPEWVGAVYPGGCIPLVPWTPCPGEEAQPGEGQSGPSKAWSPQPGCSALTFWQ